MCMHLFAALLLLPLLTLSQPPPVPPFTRWSLATNDWVTASPVVGADGSVCVARVSSATLLQSIL